MKRHGAVLVSVVLLLAAREARDALRIFKDDPLLFRPGTRYSYSSYAPHSMV